ncbi:uncharacterized protein LOC124912308 [Impatiens glandulifera]|uniref:uncharacterized protein LOC124912308 n=1 Tax=Impatiens glandulifera TaxID=253017 RepID=UPI001FB1629A|nr:uncharacterized protein LOC124912308 [Impatiens glandulifera]
MGDIVKQILAKPIQLADQVVKAADDVNNFKQDCFELKVKTEKLVGLLRQAARAGNDLYERPTRRIIEDTEQVLDKALILIFKCRANGFKRVFTIIPNTAFRKLSQQLENSIGDVSWLLRVSSPVDDRDDDDYLGGLPPIASNEPILCLIWEQIAVLASGSIEERTDAAASLVSLARDNDRYGKLIIEEGGVVPLLKLAKEGRMEGQENAARAIGLLGRDPESVEQIVNAGVCSVFAKILKDGPMKVQLVVAWAVSELAANHPKCQDHFAQNNTIRLLVSHLAFETIQEHSKYTIPTKQSMSIHGVVFGNASPSSSADIGAHSSGRHHDDIEERQLTSQVARPMTGENPTQGQVHNLITNTIAQKAKAGSGTTIPQPGQTQIPQPGTINPNIINSSSSKHHHNKGGVGSTHQHHQNSHRVNLAGTSIKGREAEDPETKAEMKAMAARALWHLCSGNVPICKNITESRALLCFAVLLEKGPEEVKYNSAMALMEITATAEENSDLRRSAFKPTSPACKAVVDQMLIIIKTSDSDLLIPCVRSVGNLARTFRATETRFIAPIVDLLEDREPEIEREAVIALAKFAETDNFLHINHSKAILEAGAAKHLVQLGYFGENMVQVPALVLLGYVALHVPDHDSLVKAEALGLIEWARKNAIWQQEYFLQSLLEDATGKLELYLPRKH